MKKEVNLVVFTLIAFVSFGLVLGYFFNTTNQNLTSTQVEDKPLENSNFIYKFFSSIFENEDKNVMLSPATEVWLSNLSKQSQGIGSESDPYDVSSPEKFTTIMRNIPENTIIHFLPGTYYTYGFGDGANNPNLDAQLNIESKHWVPKRGWKIIGSGIDITNLTLVGIDRPNDHGFVIGTVLYGSADGLEIADITLDANSQNQPNQVFGLGGIATGGIAVVGSNMSFHDFKIINTGTKTTQREGFGIVGGPHRNYGDTYNVTIKNCFIVDPLPENAREISLMSLGGSWNYLDRNGNPQNPSGRGGGFIHNLLVENCTIDGSTAYYMPGKPGFSSGQNIHGGGLSAGVINGIFRFNTVSNLTTGHYMDTWRAKDQYILNNSFINVEQGISYNFGNPPIDYDPVNTESGWRYVENLEIEGNKIILSNRTRADLAISHADFISLATGPLRNRDAPVLIEGTFLSGINLGGGKQFKPFNFGNVTIKNNYFGFYGGKVNPNRNYYSSNGYPSYVFSGNSIENITFENNIIDLNATQAINIHTYVNSIKCSNNLFNPDIPSACKSFENENFKTPGEICSANTECRKVDCSSLDSDSTNFCRNIVGFCSPDQNGVNRCHETQTSCVLNESYGPEVANGKSYCFDSFKIISCNNGVWTNSNSCEYTELCKQERIVDSWFQSYLYPNASCEELHDSQPPSVFGNFILNLNYNQPFSASFISFDNNEFLNYSINDSRFNISQNGLLTNSTPLGADSYKINIEVRDRSNNINLKIYQLNVSKINSSISLILNDVNGNLSIISGEGALISSSTLRGEGNVSLLVDGIEVNNSLSILHKINITVLGNHSVNVSHASTQNYTANSTVFYIEVREAVDFISPIFTSIPSNLTLDYGQSVNVVFSASDNKGSVSYYVNDSRFNISQNGLLTNKSVLGVEIYRINVSVNDSSNNFNSTIYQVNVNKINSSVSLLLNDVNGNLSIISGEGALISSSTLRGEGNVSLLVDGIEVNNSLSILHKINITALGNHSVNVSHASTQNYTANSTVFYIEVREAVDSISPIFTSIPSNLSLDYGQSVNAMFSASDNKGSVSYYVNDSRFNISQSGLLTNKSVLGSGKYEIKITINDSSNNINTTDYRIDVLDEQNPIILLANGLRQNLTLTYGNTVNISVNVNGFILFRNGSDVSLDAGKNVLLDAGSYNFTAVKSNFISALIVNVNKAPQTITFDSIADKRVGEEVVLRAVSSSGLPVSFEVISGENIIVPITGSFISGDNFEYNYFNVLLNIIKKFFIPQKEEVKLAPVALVGNKINLTGAGSVTVKAMQSGNGNYLPASNEERTFNVGKGNAQIVFSNINAVYDGSSKSVVANTIPSGLATIITYNGVSSSPTNADSYNVNAVVNNPNYEGSGSAIFIISKAEQTLTFNEISNKSVGEQFDLIGTSSSGLPVSFENVSGPASLSGNRLTVNGPGTIVVRAKQPGNNNYNPAQNIDRTINSDCGSGFVRVGNECKAVCTDFTYTPFGVCSLGGEQTRSVVNSIPNGCVGGLPSLNRSCTRICEPNSNISCSPIANGNVTGHINVCDSLGTNFTNENTCQLANCNTGFTLIGNECKPVCTSFTYTNFSICSINNTQTRTVIDSLPLNCVGGSPVLNQSCTYNVNLTCQPDSIIACDPVTDSIALGYKNKCNTNGTAYLNQSTCIYRKYILNRNDLNASIESGKKVLKDSSNNPIIRIPSVLDNSVFDNINIIKSSGNDSKEFLIVRNLELLSGQSKTVIFDRKSSSSNAVCIRDESDLSSASQIRANCFKVKCPGHVGDYTCSLNGNTIEVSGLQHSGVIEDRLFCGDNLCSEGESCSSCSSDCGSCSGVGSGSNSNSGSSGSNSNSGSSGSGSNPIIVDDSSSGRNNVQNNTIKDSNKIELNGRTRSSQDNSNILNYVIGFLIFLAVVILVVLVSIFIRSPQRTYVPDANNSVFERKEY